jgi:hypothetical protein
MLYMYTPLNIANKNNNDMYQYAMTPTVDILAITPNHLIGVRPQKTPTIDILAITPNNLIGVRPQKSPVRYPVEIQYPQEDIP